MSFRTTQALLKGKCLSGSSSIYRHSYRRPPNKKIFHFIENQKKIPTFAVNKRYSLNLKL